MSSSVAGSDVGCRVLGSRRLGWASGRGGWFSSPSPGCLPCQDNCLPGRQARSKIIPEKFSAAVVDGRRPHARPRPCRYRVGLASHPRARAGAGRFSSPSSVLVWCGADWPRGAGQGSAGSHSVSPLLLSPGLGECRRRGWLSSGSRGRARPGFHPHHHLEVGALRQLNRVPARWGSLGRLPNRPASSSHRTPCSGGAVFRPHPCHRITGCRPAARRAREEAAVRAGPLLGRMTATNPDPAPRGESRSGFLPSRQVCPEDNCLPGRHPLEVGDNPWRWETTPQLVNFGPLGPGLGPRPRQPAQRPPTPAGPAHPAARRRAHAPPPVRPGRPAR